MSPRESKLGRPADFFAAHPVFTHDDFVAAHTAGGRSEHTSNALLAQHVAAGRLLRVRRGLYAHVPAGADPNAHAPDPYLLTTKLRPDAVVAYHAAFAFHGRAYSVWRRHTFLTADRARPFRFRGQEYTPVQASAVLRQRPDLGGGIIIRAHAGGEVRVTTLERALVDVLDRPEHGGGWEEIWRSLGMIEYVDVAEVVRYTRLLGSAVTAARVGFVLEEWREPWMVEERALATLDRLAPAQPRYMDAKREGGRLALRWNLIVPQQVLERRWEEGA
ncbi:MAG: transcriptional regulator [Planctomycetaceae bacterium]|nr:transcriptional regulator [Planctomycetaceae bacterium]